MEDVNHAGSDEAGGRRDSDRREHSRRDHESARPPGRRRRRGSEGRPDLPSGNPGPELGAQDPATEAAVPKDQATPTKKRVAQPATDESIAQTIEEFGAIRQLREEIVSLRQQLANAEKSIRDDFAGQLAELRWNGRMDTSPTVPAPAPLPGSAEPANGSDERLQSIGGLVASMARTLIGMLYDVDPKVPAEVVGELQDGIDRLESLL